VGRGVRPPLPVTPLEALADLDRLSLPTEPDRPFHHGRLLFGCVSVGWGIPPTGQPGELRQSRTSDTGTCMLRHSGGIVPTAVCYFIRCTGAGNLGQLCGG
jgi:hypothetical protein